MCMYVCVLHFTYTHYRTGTIEVMPCSRVYHIFRKGGKPYKTNTGDVTKNKLRTAAIWMDEYAEYAYDLIGKSPKTFDVGSLDKMKELRKSLNCNALKKIRMSFVFYYTLFFHHDTSFILCNL